MKPAFLVTLCVSYLLIISCNCDKMNSGYEILPIKDLSMKMDELNAHLSYQIQDNLAVVYRMDNHQFAILPQHGEEGILFYDEISLNAMIQSGVYPVKQEKGIFAQERNLIKTLPDSLAHYFGRLPGEVNLDSKLDYTSENFAYLSKMINNYDLDKYFLETGLLLGEILRRRYGGIWQLDTVYALNPYWIPYLDINRISDPTMEVTVAIFKEISDHKSRRKKFDVEIFFRDIELNLKFLPVKFG